jgi:hypothetical protein
VERDEKGGVVSKRQREATSARQLQCPWSALCSFKDIGKRGTGDKGFVLTVQCEDHQNHQLAEDPFQFPAHLKSSEEYLEAHRQAIKHREQVLPYSVSRRLIDAEDLGVVLSSRDYYNSVRKQLPDKAKPETIVALLRMLEENTFVYTTRFKVEKDLTGKPISRKLVQLFFAHRKQLDAATRFVSDWVIIIDGTFNTNELRLPLLVAVGVLSTNETFPVAFSYCPSESAASIGFVWNSLKKECFIPASAALPRVIIGDWAAGLTSSVPKAFPEARFQGCDWHAVGAMLKFYRGKNKIIPAKRLTVVERSYLAPKIKPTYEYQVYIISAGYTSNPRLWKSWKRIDLTSSLFYGPRINTTLTSTGASSKYRSYIITQECTQISALHQASEVKATTLWYARSRMGSSPSRIPGNALQLQCYLF